MKLKLIFIFCIVSLTAGSQELPTINAGLDFLLFRGKYINQYSEANYNSKGGVFVEKPFHFPYVNNVFAVPGISFKVIHEKIFGGGLGAGVSSSLNHFSLSGYLKITHKPDFLKTGSAIFYYGGLAGAPIHTQANGSATGYSAIDESKNWDDPDHKEDPSHLYKKIYYGVLAGMEFSGTTRVTPSLEVRFLPFFANYHHHELHPFELAVNIKFGRKKREIEDSGSVP